MRKTQIVAQWSDEADFADLIAIEDRLERYADGSYDVDGHDIGSGQFNVFMYADDRKIDVAIARIIQLFQDGKLAPGMKLGVAVYVDLTRTDWSFKPVFPPGLREFEVI